MNKRLQRAKKKIAGYTYLAGMKVFGGSGLTKIGPLRNLKSKLNLTARTAAVPESVPFYGNTFFIDKNDSLELSMRGESRGKEDIKVFEEYIKPGDTAIDLGANIGFFTLVLAKIVGSKGKVYAIEPGSENLILLRKNITFNHIDNVTVIDKAAGDHDQKAKLYISTENMGDHRVYDPSKSSIPKEIYDPITHEEHLRPRDSIDIDIINLDDHLGDIKVDFIKADIQGSEYRALKGLSNILSHNRDIKVYMEFWPAGIQLLGDDPKDLLEMMEQLGFKLFLRSKPVSKDSILSEYTFENNKSCDLLLKR